MQSQRVHQAIFHLTDPLPCDISNVMSKKELATKVENVPVAARLVAQAEVAKLEEHYKTKESLLLQVKELDQELMRITIQLSNIED